MYRVLCNLLVCLFRVRSRDFYGEAVAYPGILFVRGGVQQVQLRTEERENGDLGVVAPYSGVLEADVILYKKFHFV